MNARDRTTLGAALVMYGVAGLAVALATTILGFVALDRATGAAAVLPDRALVADRALEQAASSLEAAGATADSLTNSLKTASEGLTAVHGSLGSVVSSLRQFRTDTMAVTILGQQPLVGIGGEAESLAATVETLDASVQALAKATPEDGARLTELGLDLRAMALDVRAVRASISRVLGPADVSAALSGLRLLWILVTVGLAGPPAVSLGLGVWLRGRRKDQAPEEARPSDVMTL
jgi:hypothetical protein